MLNLFLISSYLKIILVLIIALFLVNCKHKNKFTEFYDPDWRDKSSKISIEICKQISKCFQKKTQNSKPNHIQTHIEKNLQTSKCTERHKKSNVYLLKGAHPEEIKKNFLTCYESFKTLTCDQIYSGGIQKISECNWINELQKL